ncbi:MAG: hypothetical protein NTX50_01660 [Candidatus Sumerlaeota bacterium]|nr:hypothetical protein [Candidatus Sumerlaeota bacterium]
MESIISFGINESRWLGEGWHEREIWGGVHSPSDASRPPSDSSPANLEAKLVYRYTSGRAQIRLEPSWAGGRIAILLAATATQLAGPMTLNLCAEGRELAVLKLSDDRWRLIEAALPEKIAPDSMAEFTVAPVFTPGKVLRNGDFRALGVRVAAIKIES